MVYEVIRDGFLGEHVPTIRAQYRLRRDAMQAALVTHLGDCCQWVRPEGGMFFWLVLPEGVDATALLPEAVRLGMAFVPGAAFFASRARANTLRLSFVTVSPELIERGVALLAQALRSGSPAPAVSAR